jgi:hypothetical protein
VALFNPSSVRQHRFAESLLDPAQKVSDRVLNQIPEVIATGFEIHVLIKAGAGRRQQQADSPKAIGLLERHWDRMAQIWTAMQWAVVSA